MNKNPINIMRQKPAKKYDEILPIMAEIHEIHITLDNNLTILCKQFDNSKHLIKLTFGKYTDGNVSELSKKISHLNLLYFKKIDNYVIEVKNTEKNINDLMDKLLKIDCYYAIKVHKATSLLNGVIFKDKKKLVDFLVKEGIVLTKSSNKIIKELGYIAYMDHIYNGVK